MRSIDANTVKAMVRNYPRASAFWEGLDIGERVSIVILLDIVEDPEIFAPNLVKFVNQVVNSSSITFIRVWQLTDIESILSKDPSTTAQQMVESLCKKLSHKKGK